MKRHTVTIYAKLGVNSRREAVSKAVELGMISAC
jgi:ATP/maltotriose-dependent transcriptional regulator MalT